jgi:predicted YcjX-like family ATPase
LVVEDFRDAIARLITLHAAGLDDVFNRLVESRIRQVIIAAKLQGQSLEFTMQNLERFYAEGLMGDENQTSQAREETLAAWRRQLERLWPEVDVNG